ncbi:PREDICTED: glycerophosphodiester phosphodiesterase 1-like [Cyprinodon variegatus]|uniref:glycerophosphodiester phosphodiesterase 1-like n=1 Tax=Cyprinodon variegatus TaxID=28743 RepID=UPI00074285B6|nr:PREDICTED: glycerophosphodiester phosphodiesterase 1-like [Cyprinodon variegatus]
MLQFGDEVTLYSLVFVLVLVGTRSPMWSTALTASLYLFLAMFRFPQVATSRAQKVLHPLVGKVSVVAHRGGGHDAPENTIAAIREVRIRGRPRHLGVCPTAGCCTHNMRLCGNCTNKNNHCKQPTDLLAPLWVFFLAIQAAAALKDVYKRYPVLYNSSIVCSFEPKVIYRMRQSDPEVLTALTHRPWSLSTLGDGTPRFSSMWKHHWMTMMDILLDWAHHHLLWKLCGVSAFLIQKNFVSQNYIQYWAQRGVEVVAWTINTKLEKEYFQEVLHINYITDSLVEDCEPHY